MPSPVADDLVYPDPPRSRWPAPIWIGLWLLASAATVMAWALGTASLTYFRDWEMEPAMIVGLVGAVAVATPLFALASWARAPRGGWPAEFRLPLFARAFVRVLIYIGVGGLTLAGSPALVEAELPSPLVGILAVGVLIALPIAGPRVARQLCGPVGELYEAYWPRGARGLDPLTPEQVASVTGRAVAEVVRLDALHPEIPRMVSNTSYRARYVFRDGSAAEVSLLFLFGERIARTPEQRLKGTSPAARLDYLRRKHRLEAQPGLGEESYAVVPLESGDEWLWTRLTDEAVLEVRSTGYERWTRVHLARLAIEHFDPERYLRDVDEDG